MYADAADKVKKIKLKQAEKFEIYGDVLIEKTVKANGRAGGRIYLPLGWIGKNMNCFFLLQCRDP